MVYTRYAVARKNRTLKIKMADGQYFEGKKIAN